MKRAAKAMAVILTVIIIALACIVTVSYYTRGFESVAALYVKYADKVYTDGVIVLHESGRVRIDVKSAGFITETEYTLQVLPNAEKDFSYEAGGKSYKYSAVGELTEYLDIEQNNSYFVIDCASLNVTDVLTKKHGAEIRISETADGGAYFYFVITRNEISITLKVCNSTGIEDIKLPPSVVF